MKSENNNDLKSPRIDVHVHCRDWDQSYKATIKSVTEIARSQGVVAIVDMPNTSPPITTQELVDRRLKSAEQEGVLDGYYIYIGATSNVKQLVEAARIVESNPKVVGIKMYAGRSVGDLNVPDEQSQRAVYQVLSEINYKGVLAVHCEKESMFKMNLWDPNRPYTWGIARPREAEMQSVVEQISFAIEYGLKAHLHICHISVPEAVLFVNHAKKSLRISCGATPHHLTISTDDMQTPQGIVYKVNPPIRNPQDVKELRALLKEGKIDIIETDHAPHADSEKLYSPQKPPDSYMSGIPSLSTYDKFIDGLSSDGFRPEQIRKLTYDNVKRIFVDIIQ